MKLKRIASLLLTIAMLFSMAATGVPAYGEGMTEDGGLCPHHTAHTADCGYVEAQAGQPCKHVHGEDCGYAAAVEGQPCTHVCTQESGCLEVGCTHVHDADCGYVEAQAGQPCNHVHDEDCGYAAAVEGRPCTFRCQLCEYSDNVENDENGDVTLLASETISVTWQPVSIYAPIGQPVTITVSAQLDSAWVISYL